MSQSKEVAEHAQISPLRLSFTGTHFYSQRLEDKKIALVNLFFLAIAYTAVSGNGVPPIVGDACGACEESRKSVPP